MNEVHRMWSPFRLLAVAGLLGATAAGCDDDVEFVDDDGDTGQIVEVTEQEFLITLDRGSVSAGLVTFRVTNVGNEMHELLVIRTDLAPDALPIDADGAYLEDAAGTEVLDEIEDIMPGETHTLTIDLAQGNYVLVCNMVETEENGEIESHYAEGMHTGFQVVGTPAQ